MTEAEEAFLLCLSLEQQNRGQILLGERDLAVYALQAERTLLAEERKNCDYLMGKLAEALKRSEGLEIHAAALADALDGYQEPCGEDHPRPKYDCPTRGGGEATLSAYLEFIQPKG